jgi:SRSO17 transposase
MEPTNHLATRGRLNGYLDGIGSLLTDKRQRASFALYAAGLLNESERKSMEPLAARASGDPESCSAVHHRLIHLLSSAAWRDEPIRDFTTGYAIAAMQTQAPIARREVRR